MFSFYKWRLDQKIMAFCWWHFHLDVLIRRTSSKAQIWVFTASEKSDSEVQWAWTDYRTNHAKAPKPEIDAWWCCDEGSFSHPALMCALVSRRHYSHIEIWSRDFVCKPCLYIHPYYLDMMSAMWSSLRVPIQLRPFCVELARCLRVCLGFLHVLLFTPTLVQRNADYMNWKR